MDAALIVFSSMTVVVRTRNDDPMTMIPTARQLVSELDPLTAAGVLLVATLARTCPRAPPRGSTRSWCCATTCNRTAAMAAADVRIRHR
jgi:hypothetical protein